MSFFEFPHSRTYDSDLGWLMSKYPEIAENAAKAAASEEAARASEEAAAQSMAQAASSAEAAAASADQAASSYDNMVTEVQEVTDTLNARLSQAIAAVTPTGTELTDIRVGYDGTVYTTAGDAVRGQVEDLNNALDQYAAKSDFLEKYLYKKNKYVNADGVETELAGYNLYRIPFKDLSAIWVEWDNTAPFYADLNTDHVFDFVTDSGYTSIIPFDNNTTWYSVKNGYALIFAVNGETALSICVKNDRTAAISFRIIAEESPDKYVKELNTVTEINEYNACKTKYFFTSKLIEFPNNGFSYLLHVNAGDRVTYGTMATFSYAGMYLNRSDLTWTRLPTSGVFTVPEDGMLFAFGDTPTPYIFTYYPADSIRIEYNNIVNTPVSDRLYDGLNGIIFGTSLSYRSGDAAGYMDYLPELSGITFDNQAAGNAQIVRMEGYNCILDQINDYTGYSGKRVCILEGFVNDWFRNSALGTWSDAAVTTVCGAVRTAINTIASRNRSMKIFLVLDHYGRNYNGVDCSTTATNSAGLTQYQYYDEIAKTAESLGIIVIREYALSEISENMPQYLLDNIHCSALGAEQSAKTIWAGMKNFYPNV